MPLTPDARVGGPLPPEEPEISSTGTLPPTERDQDPVREELERQLVNEPARPLTREEREAARDDVAADNTVYAPASERVAKSPIPGDDKHVLGGALADDEPDGRDLDPER